MITWKSRKNVVSFSFSIEYNAPSQSHDKYVNGPYWALKLVHGIVFTIVYPSGRSPVYGYVSQLVFCINGMSERA